LSIVRIKAAQIFTKKTKNLNTLGFLFRAGNMI